MELSKIIWRSEIEYLCKEEADEPVFFFAPDILAHSAQMFRHGFPGLVSYAVKTNPRPEIIENLLSAGIFTFDVASPGEIRLVQGMAPDAVLHYHNPVRSAAEISMALKAGVRSFSVDRTGELDKLAGLARGLKIEVSVRLKLPLDGGAYNFGLKFGATPEAAQGLLRQVAGYGFTPSMTFHPGTQCKKPDVWQAYIRACADVSRLAQVPIARLNTGGGFPARRRAGTPAASDIFDAIRQAADEGFGPDAPGLVCEPGRAMVAESYALATRVKAIGPDGEVFLNDGLYGGLSELPVIEPSDRFRVIRNGRIFSGQRTSLRTVFGPTCDSLDKLPAKMPLPIALAEGDHLVFYGAGAYGAATSTGFNGYGQHRFEMVLGLSAPPLAEN